MNSIPNEGTPAWREISPLLEEAMGTLARRDQDAVVLRFFRGQSLRQVGEALELSEDAAQKGLSRALEQRRDYFARRGVKVSATVLASGLAAHAIEAAPAGVAAAISTAVITPGVALSAAGTLGFAESGLTKAILMTTTQKVTVIALLNLAVGAGVFQAHRAGQMRTRLLQVEGQLQPLTEQANQLRQERDNLNARLQHAQAQMELLQHTTDELARLRGELARLRNDAQELTRLKAQLPAISPVTLADRIALMESNLEQRPEWRIPELQFADEKDWLAAAELVTTELADNVRKAVSLLRTAAKLKFGRELSLALRKFTAANNGDLPTDLFSVKPYFSAALDDAVLQRWEIYVTGNTREPGFNSGITVVREKLEMLPDALYDERVRVGLNNSTMEGSKSGFPRLENYELE